MGKLDVIYLKPDQTFREVRKNTDETIIKMGKEWTPTFTQGKSVFQETGVSRFKFWKRERRLVLLFDGALSAFEVTDTVIEQDGEEITVKTLGPRYWTLKEVQAIVRKIVAKSKASEKLLSGWQTIGIFLGQGVTIFLLIMLLRGVGVV